MKNNTYNTNLLAVFLIGLFTLLSCKSNSQDQPIANSPELAVTIFKDVSVDEAKKMIAANKDLIIIDVRTPGEIAEGKIEGALEIDYYAPDFNDKMSALDKDKEYLIYCRSGGRSSDCLGNMKEMGFKNASNMLGGFNEWK